MNLLRIGQLIVNMDRATCVRDLSTRDTSGQVIRGLIRIEFAPDDYVVIPEPPSGLRTWLTDHSTDAGSTTDGSSAPDGGGTAP
jgi:hypothetical protein